MSKFIVVSVHRDRWFWPKLTIVIEARVSSESAGQKFITEQVMKAYEKRRGKVYVRVIGKVFTASRVSKWKGKYDLDVWDNEGRIVFSLQKRELV